MQKRNAVLFFLIFLLPLQEGSAQDNGTGGLTVKGIVTYEGTPMEGAEVNVYDRKSRLVEKKESRRNGAFRVRLALDGYYIIEFEREGMVSKRLLFRTHTPQHDKAYHPFDIEVMMFRKERARKDPEIDMDLPLGIVKYFPEKEDFDYVEKYTIERLKEQAELLKEEG